MGTTAQKLEYLNATKQQLKSALNTDSNVFRDYVALTQKYVNNNPTSTVTNGTCTNALDVPAKNYKVFGNSTQNTTTGKNKLNPANFTATTYITNIDENTNIMSISLNSYTNFVQIFNNLNLQSGNYTIFCEVIEGTYTGGNLCFYDLDNIKYDTEYNFRTGGQFKNITLSNGLNKLQIYAPNCSTNCKIKLWIMSGTYSSVQTYEPYTGGIASPNPSYPQEITSVGDLVTSGEHTGKYKIPITVTGENEGEVFETDIYLDKPLRGIGTAKDYIEFVTGKRHNLCGKVVLNGGEAYINKNITDNNLLFSTPVIDGLFNTSNLSNIISNYFSFNSNLWTYDIEAFILINMSASLRFRINKNLLSDISTQANAVNSFKTWLSTHNTEVIYQLATPIEENITLPRINFWEGTNIITIGTGVQATQEIVYITKGGN